MTSKTREQWLLVAADMLGSELAQHGAEVPPVRVSVGFPRGSHGRAKAIGQCWNATTVADGKPAIFISPELDDPVRILDVLLHELIHAAMPLGTGHRKAFSQLAAKVGLVKPWTATTASPDLKERLTKMAKHLGEFDHARVNDAKRPRQTTRMLKVECPTCGYLVRTTRKMLDIGNPICPEGDEMWEV